MAGKMRRFTFWENYYLPMKRIKDRAKRAELALKILEVAFEESEPDFDDLEGLAADAIVPLIHEDMNGNKGGRPSKTYQKPGSNSGSSTSKKTASKTGLETRSETPLNEAKRSEAENVCSENKHFSASGDTAAADAAPPDAKPLCPLCRVETWKNTQTGKYHCPSCLDSFETGAVVWP